MAGYFDCIEPNAKIDQPWFVYRPDEALWAAALCEPRHNLQVDEDAGAPSRSSRQPRSPPADDVYGRIPESYLVGDRET